MPSEENRKSAAVVAARDVSVYFGTRKALKSVSLDLYPGEILGIIGPNGAGKSTLINALLGLRKPELGQVTLAGFDPFRQPIEARARFGMTILPEVLPQSFTGRKYLDLVSSLRGIKGTGWPIPELDARLNLTPWLDEHISTYSFGTQMKLSICGSFIGAPPVLVFDEPLNGLDPLASYEFKSILKEARDMGYAILLTTHMLEVVAQLCDRATLMMAGRLLRDWDRPAMLAARADPTSFETKVVEAIRQSTKKKEAG